MPEYSHDKYSLRDRLIGLGERSVRKSYYPELQHRLGELERFRAIMDQVGEAIFVFDPENLTISEANLTASSLSGLPPDDLLGMRLDEILPEEDASVLSALPNNGEEAAILETTFPNGDTERTFELNARMVGFGDQRLCVAVVRDITSRKVAELRLQNSLREKEVMLREIHHRVKNNLQIISSLFNLQIMHGGRGTEDIFRTAQGRIQSMALVHERLYQTENLSAVPFDDYMRRISEDLISTYSVQERVSLRIESEPIYLPLDTAIPLGLIVNEIITNSLKHAFGDDLAGTITVSFQEVSGECRLLICDTGEGFADNAHSAEERLGLKLISTLAGQIRGSVEFPPTDQGACLLVRFPYPDK